MSARVVHKYVMNAIDDPNLRLFTVWGPMLGPEQRADAEVATALLPDPRVSHFWSDGHEVAEILRPAAGLPEGERAWDTYQLYAAGARWGDAPPTPDFVMHVGKRLPEDRRLDGAVLAEHIRALLAARPGSAPPPSGR
jgi:hypothetical protein